MRRASVIFAVFLTLPSAVCAGDHYTTPGMPVCDTPEHLKEFLLAGVSNDQRWMNEIKDACPSVKGGLKAAIIEELSGDSTVMHVVKVRVFSAYSRGSATGYTVDIGLVDTPSGR